MPTAQATTMTKSSYLRFRDRFTPENPKIIFVLPCSQDEFFYHSVLQKHTDKEFNMN
jgi:hypothetical protein